MKLKNICFLLFQAFRYLYLFNLSSSKLFNRASDEFYFHNFISTREKNPEYLGFTQSYTLTTTTQSVLTKCLPVGSNQMYVSAKYELTVQRGSRNYHVGIHAGDLSSCSETGCAVVYREHCLLCVLTFSSATSCQAVHYASKRPQRLRLVFETQSSEKTTVLQEFSVCGSALSYFTHPHSRQKWQEQHRSVTWKRREPLQSH